MSMQQPLHKYHCQKAQETAGETVQETDGLTEEQGNEIIMAARAHWFDDEPETEEAADADSSQ